MRLRLLKRRLTISAPRMAVRSHLPWPFRWAVVAIVLGFCAAIGLWAFEFGKDIAGLDRGVKEELAQLRQQHGTLQQELVQTQQERDAAQAVANTSGTLVATEKAAQEQLAARLKLLEQENQALRDDLHFFERLIPAAGNDPVAIRGLHAETVAGQKLHWQVLVIQSAKNAPELSASLELMFTGVLNGKPWSMALPGGALSFRVKQYGRLEGEIELPAQAQVRGVTARVLEGSTVRSTHTIKL
ncbi:MAG: DUF6776 family protein [Rhodoferax sp.]